MTFPSLAHVTIAVCPDHLAVHLSGEPFQVHVPKAGVVAVRGTGVTATEVSVRFVLVALVALVVLVEFNFASALTEFVSVFVSV